MSKILIWETLSKIGGGQEMTLKVADVLKSDHELHFLIPEQGELSKELEKRNIGYTLMGDQSMPKGEKGFKGLLKFAYLTVKATVKGRKIVKSMNPDILYAPGPAALAWSAMCAKRNTAVIWHLHHIFQSGATLRLLNFLSAQKCVKRIISVSDFVSEQITNQKSKSKKITVYNPVEPVCETAKRKNLCEEFSFIDKEVKIAQIGFITPTKNQHTTLEIVKCLKKKGVDVSLSIIGSVTQQDKDYKDLLDKKINEYNLSDNVVFVGYRSDVPYIMSTFDVVIVPSVEGFSLVAVEAISENVPVLCADNSGCTEIIRATSCGMIYSPDSSVDVIADTLLKTITIDVKSTKEKHPVFLYSECSYDNFKNKINQLFSN